MFCSFRVPRVDVLGSHHVSAPFGEAFCELAVEAYGGRVHVQSTAGMGSAFSFAKPLRSHRVIDPLLTPKRVLVADDDPAILHLVSTILRRAHYRVDTASNGKEALQESERTWYDAIVLDLMMPGVSGFEVLRRLQRRDVGPKFVVVMSAASELALVNATGPNVFATLRKPFDIDEITDAVDACVAQLH